MEYHWYPQHRIIVLTIDGEWFNYFHHKTWPFWRMLRHLHQHNKQSIGFRARPAIRRITEELPLYTLSPSFLAAGNLTER
jgi:hypothetical protein